jgi:hypothetical protein
MLDALCDDTFISCESNMQEQDWESLGTVVDLESEIPWAGSQSEGGEAQSSGVDLSSTHTAPLHFSNENQDEFDISWLGTKHKTNGHMQFNSSATEAMNDCGFETVTCWSGLPVQKGITVPTSPKTLRKPTMLLDQASESPEISSEEEKYLHAHDDDSLPLIEDDTGSHLPVHRTSRKAKSATHLYDHDSESFPGGDAAPHCGFPLCTAGPIAPSGPTTLFPLHLFVAAVAEGSFDPSTPERTLSILDQVPPRTARPRHLQHFMNQNRRETETTARQLDGGVSASARIFVSTRDHAALRGRAASLRSTPPGKRHMYAWHEMLAAHVVQGARAAPAACA